MKQISPDIVSIQAATMCRMYAAIDTVPIFRVIQPSCNLSNWYHGEYVSNQ